MQMKLRDGREKEERKRRRREKSEEEKKYSIGLSGRKRKICRARPLWAKLSRCRLLPRFSLGGKNFSSFFFFFFFFPLRLVVVVAAGCWLLATGYESLGLLLLKNPLGAKPETRHRRSCFSGAA